MWGELIGGIFQAGVGLMQMDQAKKIKEEAGDRPDYEIPTEVKKIAALARANLGDSSRHWETQALDRLDMSANQAYQQSVALGNPFAAIAGIQATHQKGYGDIALQVQEEDKQLRKEWKSALMNVVPHKQLAFELNQLTPWQDAQEESQKKEAAGYENINTSIGNLGSVADSLTYAGLKQGTKLDEEALGALTGKYSTKPTEEEGD